MKRKPTKKEIKAAQRLGIRVMCYAITLIGGLFLYDMERLKLEASIARNEYTYRTSPGAADGWVTIVPSFTFSEGEVTITIYGASRENLDGGGIKETLPGGGTIYQTMLPFERGVLLQDQVRRRGRPITPFPSGPVKTV